MKVSNLKKSVGVFLLALSLGACRVIVSTDDGGSVRLAAGEWTCSSDSLCPVEVSDLFFDETFIASADRGFAFTGWDQLARSFCGGTTGTCRLFTSIFEGNEILMALLASDEEFYLYPTFGRHERDGFHGDWEGVLLAGDGTSRPEHVELEIEIYPGGEVELYEDRSSTDWDCEYTGRFDVTSTAGRNARDTVSGQFECDTAPFTRGSFQASLAAVTDHHLIVEIDLNPDNGEMFSLTQVLAREDNFVISNSDRAAKVRGAPVSARNFRTIEAWLVYSEGSDCYDGRDLDSEVELALSRDGGSISLSMTEDGEFYCEYDGASGDYRCDDGGDRATGTWRESLSTTPRADRSLPVP